MGFPSSLMLSQRRGDVAPSDLNNGPAVNSHLEQAKRDG